MATDRKFIPLLNEDDNNPKKRFACSHAPRISYDLDNFSSPGRLTDYKIVNCGDLSCQENHVQLMFKKETLENGFSDWKQKENEKSGGNGQKKQKEIKQKLYACNLCDSSYKEKFHLESHLEIFHNRAVPIELPVPVAFRETNSKTNIEKSLGLHGKGTTQGQEGGNDFFCYTCNAKFSKKSSLALHIDLVHQAANCPSLVVCLLCQQSFDQQAVLDKHILRRHPSWRPLFCNVCGDSFALLKTLNQHQLALHKDIYSNENKMQKNDASDVVRLTYAECSIPTNSEENTNFSNGHRGISKRRKTVATPKKMRKNSIATGENHPNFENKLEGRKYSKNSITQCGSQTKKSRHSFERENEQRLSDRQEHNHTKRRKLENSSVDIKRDHEQLFQYECQQCQLQIPSLKCLFRHIKECPKKVIKIESNSKEGEAESHGYRNIQLDCRMGGRESDFGKLLDFKNGRSHTEKTEVVCKKEALMDTLFDGETTRANQILISCGFCEYTATTLLEFNDHLAVHGI